MLANSRCSSLCTRRSRVGSRRAHKLQATNLSTLSQERRLVSVNDYKTADGEVHVILNDASGLIFAQDPSPGHAVNILEVLEGYEAYRCGKIHAGDTFSKVSAVVEDGDGYRHVVVNVLLMPIDLVSECVRSHINKDREYPVHIWLFHDDPWE